MATRQFERTDRIAAEVMREVERIIREEVSDPRTDCMFSVTHVDVTRDLRYAKVFISVYEEEKREPMMKALRSAAGFVRHHLGHRVQLRYTPAPPPVDKNEAYRAPYVPPQWKKPADVGASVRGEENAHDTAL